MPPDGSVWLCGTSAIVLEAFSLVLITAKGLQAVNCRHQACLQTCFLICRCMNETETVMLHMVILAAKSNEPRHLSSRGHDRAIASDHDQTKWDTTYYGGLLALLALLSTPFHLLVKIRLPTLQRACCA